MSTSVRLLAHDFADVGAAGSGLTARTGVGLSVGAGIRLLGLDFADIDAAQAAAAIAARPVNAPFAYVVTPNADHLVRIARQPALLPFYHSADLCLLDSRVVRGAAWALGLACPPVATGSDVTSKLLQCHTYPGERVTIVGLRAEHVPALTQNCNLVSPAHYDPPMGFDRDPDGMQRTVEFVLAHPARFILLAVGSPRQERLAAAIAATGQATGTALCIGASLNFLAGVEQRAPQWMRRVGLEWLNRLANNPQRLGRRYLLDNPPIFALLLRERLGMLHGSVVPHRDRIQACPGNAASTSRRNRASVPPR